MYPQRRPLIFVWAVFLIFPLNCLATFAIEKDDSDIYLGCKNFGTITRNANQQVFDLDKIHHDFFIHEKEITEIIRKQDKNSRNNIVIAGLTFLTKDSIIKPITIEYEEAGDGEGDSTENDGKNSTHKKIRIFESAFSSREHTKKIPEKLKEKYHFNESLSDLDVLLKQINDIWGRKEGEKWKKKPDLSDKEKEIWKDFKKRQHDLWKAQEEVKSTLIETVLEPTMEPLKKLALSLKGNNLDQSKELKKFLGNEVAKPSTLVEEIIKKLSDKKTQLQAKERDFTTLTGDLYRWFWHSEQRLIHFLSTDESSALWDSLVDQCANEDKIEVIFLHLHSHYNLCHTCRRMLARAVQKGNGILWQSISSKTGQDDFLIKVLGSFGTHYPALEKWVPHQVKDQVKTIPKVRTGEDWSDTPPIFLKKISVDEELLYTTSENTESSYSKEIKTLDEKYSVAWNKWIWERINKSTSNQEKESYLLEHSNWLTEKISRLEYRVQRLELRVSSTSLVKIG